MTDDAKYMCDVCNGKGKEPIPEGMSASTIWMGSCQKCGGSGELDWLENIVGKKQDAFVGYSTTGLTDSNWSSTISSISNACIVPASASIEYVDTIQADLKTYIDEEIQKRVKEEIDKLMKDK